MRKQVTVEVTHFITIFLDVPEGADTELGVHQTLETLDISNSEDSLGEVIETQLVSSVIKTETNMEE